MEISVALVAPKSPQNVGAVARAMANFGFTKLYVSPFDGTDVPSVEVAGSRASFTKFAEGTDAVVAPELQNRITLRFPTPDGKILSFPGRELSETLESFFRLVPSYQAQVLDAHGCVIHGTTPHAFAWVDKGRLLLQENGKATSLLLRDESHVRYGGHLRAHDFVAVTAESYWMATSAESRAVLDSHSVFSKLIDLRGEFDFIIGTSGSPPQLDKTRKTRSFSHPNAGDIVTTPNLLKELARMAEGHQGSREHIKVLLVFGREMTGLHQEELASCDRLVIIPTLPWTSSSTTPSSTTPSSTTPSSTTSSSTTSSTSSPFASSSAFPPVGPFLTQALANSPSLNLSHAVAIVLYALNQELGTLMPPKPKGDAASQSSKYMSARERDILHTAFAALRRATSRVEVQADDAVLQSVRRALDRASLSRLEFHHLMGLIASANRLLEEAHNPADTPPHQLT